LIALIHLALVGAPSWGSGQAPDLRGIGYDRGSPEARVVVVEFGDFGCPACGQFAREVWPAVAARFVETGRVAWKYVPFVLGAFPNGDEAARAAECAGAQDKFWAMHDRLFEEQGRWGRQRNPLGSFVSHAEALGLDATEFERCYREDAGRERTKRANEAAKAMGVRGTPTFFINGERVVGAYPAEEFIERLLKAGAGR
jgi:protein-disulfide isomerase